MYIITARRITSGELLQQRKGPCIRQGFGPALPAYLSEITERVIREEVHRETGDADEVDEPRRIGR